MTLKDDVLFLRRDLSFKRDGHKNLRRASCNANGTEWTGKIFGKIYAPTLLKNFQAGCGLQSRAPLRWCATEDGQRRLQFGKGPAYSPRRLRRRLRAKDFGRGMAGRGIFLTSFPCPTFLCQIHGNDGTNRTNGTSGRRQMADGKSRNWESRKQKAQDGGWRMRKICAGKHSFTAAPSCSSARRSSRRPSLRSVGRYR